MSWASFMTSFSFCPLAYSFNALSWHPTNLQTSAFTLPHLCLHWLHSLGREPTRWGLELTYSSILFQNDPSFCSLLTMGSLLVFNQALISTMSSLVDHFLLSTGLTNPGEVTGATAESRSIGGLLCEANKLTNPWELREEWSIVFRGLCDFGLVFRGLWIFKLWLFVFLEVEFLCFKLLSHWFILHNNHCSWLYNNNT